MSEVSKILERNLREAEFDGITFKVRRATGRDFIEAYGSAALGLVDAVDGKPAEQTPEGILEGYDKMRRICALCMVSPRLGDVSDVYADTVSWADLGDLQKRVFDLIVGNTFDEAKGFQEPSEVSIE